MRSGAFHRCQRAHPLSLATMRASRELSTPDLQPRPSVTGYHGRLAVPVKKTSSGLQSSATWTSNSGDLMSDTDEIANRDDFVEEYNRLAKKACSLVSSHRLRLTDHITAWCTSTRSRPSREPRGMSHIIQGACIYVCWKSVPDVYTSPRASLLDGTGGHAPSEELPASLRSIV